MVGLQGSSTDLSGGVGIGNGANAKLGAIGASSPRIVVKGRARLPGERPKKIHTGRAALAHPDAALL